MMMIPLVKKISFLPARAPSAFRAYLVLALRPFMAYLRLALGIVDITQRTNRLTFVGIRRRSLINIALGLCRLIA